MRRKTKIVCTIGPATQDVSALQRLIANGMDIARLNFSHGSHQYHSVLIENIRTAAQKEGKIIGILLDTQGPEMRTGELEASQIELVEGKTVVLTTEVVLGNQERISVSYHGLPDDVFEGLIIRLDDGLIDLRVKRVVNREIICQILNGGSLGSRKGINVPGAQINLPGITEKDIKDIEFGIAKKVDFVAASFVRKPEDVLDIRRILEQNGSDIQVVSKIENQEGIENLDRILEISDGIMVARGDLGVEIPAEEVPLIQKEVIRKCNMLDKPVITATQMLDSMQRNPHPTRAEASDVANAIFDGTDAVMLSGETALGKYPFEAVHTMSQIILKTETALSYQELFRQRVRETNTTITDSISQAVVHISHHLDCEAIITATESGYTARMVSKYRPKALIIAVTPSEKVCRKLLLVWGIYPVLGIHASTTDEMFQSAITTSISQQFVDQGDLVIITAGVPVGKSGTTNLMKVHVIGDVLATGKGIGKKVVTNLVVVGRTAEELRTEMKDGAIVVTTSTDKDMMDFLGKASAIITEEGGLTSHAAVVGISLGIPVIVGVDQAISLLEHETIVTVDSVHGHIYSGRANIL